LQGFKGKKKGHLSASSEIKLLTKLLLARFGDKLVSEIKYGYQFEVIRL